MSNHSANAIRTQQRFIRAKKTETHCLSTFNLITGDILLDELEILLPEHRERLFPPTETLAMFISQIMNSDQSSQ